MVLSASDKEGREHLDDLSLLIGGKGGLNGLLLDGLEKLGKG